MKMDEKKAIRGADMDAQAQEIMRIAEAYNVEKNFFFRTTFERYLVQIETLRKIKEQMDGSDMLITKEYVKGRCNLYPHPGVASYSSVSTSANRTVETLIKIVNTMGSTEETGGQDDPLLKALRGEE